MADDMRGREYKTKVKKKRERRDEKCHDHSLNKLKRKRTSSKEEENECMDNTYTVYKKRNRKGSESESDWSVRRESNTELIWRKTESRMGKAEQGTELVICKKKKKKKVKCENKPEENTVTELAVLKKKKVKKNKREKEIQNSATEHSIFEPSPVIEGREEEDVDAFARHTFLKPFSVQERRGEKNSCRRQRYRGGGGRADTAEERELSDSYRDKRLPEVEKGEKSYAYLNKGKPEERQREDIAEPEQGRAEKRRLPGPTSCQAYNDIHGWETDTSVDDLDYSDDHYHQSPSAIRSRIMQGRKKSSQKNNVMYSEGEEVEGFVPDPRYSLDNEDYEWSTVEVPSDERSSPGLTMRARDSLSLEKSLYKFPPGFGVPPEEVEEVKEAEDYWLLKEKVLQTSRFAEEAREYINSKIQYIEDYFHRLRRGHLTPSELKETRPENFDEPFFPTPRQLKFLNSLNIKVNWPLSELHTFHVTTYTMPLKAGPEWHCMKIFADTSRFSPMEDKIVVRNWFAFQKEYSFYDLRPFVPVRTARLVREAGQLTLQPYEYVSNANKVHFLLYMAKDLPYRTLKHMSKRLHKLLPFLRGQCLLRQSHRVTGLLLAKFLYVMELFGADMLAAELLIGPCLKAYYTRCFATHIMLRNIKLRVGPWHQDEDERFLHGLKEVVRVKNYEEAYKLKRIPWMAIFPYVRTRSISYMRRRLIVLASRDGEKDNLSAMRNQMAKFIRLLYSKQVDDFTCLDWEGLARQAGATNPIRLVWSFRKLYFNYIPYSHRGTVPEGLRYMYERMLSFYERKEVICRIPQPGDPDYQEHQHSQYNPNNPSNLRHDPNSELAHPSVDPSNSSINSTDVSNDLRNPGRGSSNSEDPSNDPSDSSNESTNSSDPSVATHNSDDSSLPNCKAINPNSSRKVNSNNPNYISNPRIASSNKDDHSNHMIANAHHQNYPVKLKKRSTIHLYDPRNMRKVSSNPDDSRTFKEVNSTSQYDLNYLKKHSSSNSHKPSQSSHHQLEGDPSSPAMSNQCDLENCLNSCDLSDSDGLTSSESDSDNFETGTLGQAIGRNVSAIRGSEYGGAVFVDLGS